MLTNYNAETVRIRVAELLTVAYTSWQFEEKEYLTEKEIEEWITRFDNIEQAVAKGLFS